MSVISNNQLAGAAGQGGAAGYKIERSLRFNSADSASLSRTPSVVGNKQKFTLSTWVKRTDIVNSYDVLLGIDGSFGIYFTNTDKLHLDLYAEDGSSWAVICNTQAVFRDTSSWYHVVISIDSTTGSTNADRIKCWVNGVQQTFDFSTYWGGTITGNIDQVNTQLLHTIGARGSSLYSDLYLADYHFIDGQALAPTDFGEFDDNNVWQPKEFEGSYAGPGFIPGANISYGSWANVFNGSTTGHAFTYSSATSTATLSPGIAWSSKVRIYGLQYTTSHVKINGGSALTGFNTTPKWVDVTSQVGSSGTLSTVEINDIGTNYFKLFAIELDDTILDLGQAGVNGFHLDFSDNSSASALGTDSSGNSNDWTVNNLNPVESVGLPSGYTASSSTYSGTLSSIDTDDSSGIRAASSHIDFDLGASYTVGTVTAKFLNAEGSASANYRIELHGNSSYTNLLANSATVNAPSSGAVQTITHDFSSTSARYLRFAYQGGGRVATLRFLSTTGATAGNAGCDSLIDTPTNYTADSGNNGGNYCTLNAAEAGGYATLSNGNLDQSGGSTDYSGKRGTFSMLSGKWYWEVTINGTNGVAPGPGIQATDVPNYESPVSTRRTYYTDGTKFDGTQTSYGATFTTGDIIGVAFDADAGSLTFYKNGSSQGVAFSSLSDGPYSPLTADFNGSSTSHNFGQRPFTYTPPSGYKSLCTTNLPDPTIADGSTAFDVITYAGTDETRTFTGFNFSPDLAWFKSRSYAFDHVLFDNVRGATKRLKPNSSGAESINSTGLTAFTSDGFTVGGADSLNGPYTFVAWAWDAGTSTVSNTDGSVTTSVRANPSAGFSIVTYTGNATNGATVGHGLNAAPDLIIIKNRDDGGTYWVTYHSALGGTKALALNRTDSVLTNSLPFNNTDPTSSVFTIGAGGSYSYSNNQSGEDHLALCFSAVEGYSAFGSYEGNGSSDGPFVFTGFKPRWIMIKSSTLARGWKMYDAARDTYNACDHTLLANASDAETTSSGDRVDFLSNGFKIRTAGDEDNGSGDTYLYMCFAKNPFKTARAR